VAVGAPGGVASCGALRSSHFPAGSALAGGTAAFDVGGWGGAEASAALCQGVV